MADETDRPQGPPRAQAPRAIPGNRRVLLPTLLTVGAIMFAGAIFTGVWTDRLWFRSLGYSEVFNKILLTRAALFIILGAFFATVVCANIVIAHRTQPLLVPRPRRLDPVARYREVIEPIRSRLVAVVFLLLMLSAGGIAAGHWQTYLQWRNGQPFGRTDAEFNKDIGFFVFDYPWYRFLASYGFSVLAVSIIAVALVNYLYGGISLQDRTGRVTGPAQVQLSVLVGLFVLLKAFAYWLDRFALTMADGALISGITYTDDNARIPSKNILIVIAIICSLLFFANVVRRSWLLPTLGLGLLVLSSLLIGGIWPAVMQSFQVKPSEPEKERPYIQRNIEATRLAYDVDEVKKTPYDATTELTPEALEAEAQDVPGTRLLDPTLVSDAFEQLQQVRGYYSVPQTLDVDRYQFADSEQTQDVVIAARELDLTGLSDSQRNWANDHTVFTHGYGVVAARGNVRGNQGEPSFVVEDIPLKSADPSLEVDQPRIYFGENSPDYSIVGRDDDADVEVDIPQGSGTGEETTDSTRFTYDGAGGVDVGSLFNQVLYALKFGEPNLVLSDRVTSASKILYDREPRDRVEQVAPWLTVDGNAYPSIVDGRIVWIVDAYTTTNSYPQSEKTSLEDATSDSLTETSQVATLPSDQVNYMRNSVKAVVDAYDGTVELYEWDEEDPILQTWMQVFPDAVNERAEIPQPLLEHLRYPEDMFKVQREILSRYHVEDAASFYNGDERWLVPEDPTTDQATQPPYYLSVKTPGSQEPTFSLTSVFVPNSRENLASFVSVNSDATDESDTGYGTLQILSLPSTTQVPGPNQMQNQINTDDGVVNELLPFRERSTVLTGNLLTLPVGDGLLYVQPIYTRATGDTGTYPVLQFVSASFGDEVGLGTSLNCALNQVLGIDADDVACSDPVADPGGADPDPGNETETVEQLLADAATLFEEANAALEDQDLGVYQQKVSEANALVEQAQELLAEQSGEPLEEETPTETPTAE